MYAVRFTDDAVKDLKRNLSRSEKNSLKGALEKVVAAGPISCSVELVEPLAGYRSYHFGGHRVVFRIFEEKKLVVVVGVGKKEVPQAVYERLENLVTTGKLADSMLDTLRMFRQ